MMIPIALTIAVILAALLMLTAKPAQRHRNDTTPRTREQRIDAYERRVDDTVGLNSDAHLARVARATPVKAAMLARCALSERVSRHRALVAIGPVRLRTRTRPRRRQGGQRA